MSSVSKTFHAVLQIGGAFASSFKPVFGRTNAELKKVAEEIKKTRREMRDLDKSIKKTGEGDGLQKLKQKYEEAGKALEEFKKKQEQLRITEEKNHARLEARAKYQGMLGKSVAGTAALAVPVGLALHKASEASTLAFDAMAVSQMTGGDMKKAGMYEQQILDIAKATNTSPLEALKEFKFAASMNMKGGIPTALVNTKQAMKMGSALHEDPHDWAETFYAASVQMKVPGEQMARLGDVLGQVAHDGHFSSLGRYAPEIFAGAAAHGMTGIEGAKKAALMLQMARQSAGSDELAMTYVKDMLHGILMPRTDKRTGKQIVEIDPETEKRTVEAGFSLSKVYKKALHDGMDPIQAVLLELRKHVYDKDNKDLAATNGVDMVKLQKFFGNQYESGGIAAMLVHWDEYQKRLVEIEEQSHGYIDKVFNARMETLGSSLGRLTNAAESAQIQIGEALAPDAKILAGWMSSVAGWFESLAKSSPGVVRAFTWVAGVAGVIGMAIAGIGMLSTYVVPILVAGGTAIAAVFGALSLPAWGVVAAVTAVGAGLLWLAHKLHWFGWGSDAQDKADAAQAAANQSDKYNFPNLSGGGRGSGYHLTDSRQVIINVQPHPGENPTEFGYRVAAEARKPSPMFEGAH